MNVSHNKANNTELSCVAGHGHRCGLSGFDEFFPGATVAPGNAPGQFCFLQDVATQALHEFLSGGQLWRPSSPHFRSENPFWDCISFYQGHIGRKRPLVEALGVTLHLQKKEEEGEGGERITPIQPHKADSGAARSHNGVLVIV